METLRETASLQHSELERDISARMELRIFLDSLIGSLRVQADLLAEVVPFFFGESEIGKMPRWSFREHRKWFVKHGAELDPAYVDLLKSNTAWFDEMAPGGSGGLRDLITHFLGTYQIGGARGADGIFEPRISVVAERGFVIDSAIPELKKLLTAKALFLDDLYAHFFKQLGSRGGVDPPKVDPRDLSQLVRFEDVSRPSALWLYPRI